MAEIIVTSVFDVIVTKLIETNNLLFVFLSSIIIHKIGPGGNHYHFDYCRYVLSL